jgi:hypothetical protein
MHRSAGLLGELMDGVKHESEFINHKSMVRIIRETVSSKKKVGNNSAPGHSAFKSHVMVGA